jgi:hypothetical protein
LHCGGMFVCMFSCLFATMLHRMCLYNNFFFFFFFFFFVNVNCIPHKRKGRPCLARGSLRKSV